MSAYLNTHGFKQVCAVLGGSPREHLRQGLAGGDKLRLRYVSRYLSIEFHSQVPDAEFKLQFCDNEALASDKIANHKWKLKHKCPRVCHGIRPSQQTVDFAQNVCGGWQPELSVFILPKCLTHTWKTALGQCPDPIHRCSHPGLLLSCSLRTDNMRGYALSQPAWEPPVATAVVGRATTAAARQSRSGTQSPE